jgi:hypothetical protein
MAMKIFPTLTLLFCFASLWSYSQRYSPVLIDSRLASKGEYEGGLGYSSNGFVDDGRRNSYLNSIDAQVQYGLSDRINLSLRYQQSYFASELFNEWAFSLLFVGANFKLKDNWLSLYVPLGTRFSASSSDPGYIEISPTLLFSVPISPNIAFNPSLEVGLPFCSECADDLPILSTNFGLGIYPIRQLSVFIEYDLVFKLRDTDSGHNYIISGGASYKF